MRCGWCWFLEQRVHGECVSSSWDCGRNLTYMGHIKELDLRAERSSQIFSKMGDWEVRRKHRNIISFFSHLLFGNIGDQYKCLIHAREVASILSFESYPQLYLFTTYFLLFLIFPSPVSFFFKYFCHFLGLHNCDEGLLLTTSSRITLLVGLREHYVTSEFKIWSTTCKKNLPAGCLSLQILISFFLFGDLFVVWGYT